MSADHAPAAHVILRGRSGLVRLPAALLLPPPQQR
jgi:hypothetical protein